MMATAVPKDPDGRQVIFLGSKSIGAVLLSELHRAAPGRIVGAVTIDDRDDRRSAYEEIKALCESNGIDLHVAANRKESEAIIGALRPTFGVVAGWYWLISSKTLRHIGDGLIGVHYSDLPRYRGGSPLVWAVINGESSATASLFSIGPGMDEGEIWGKATVPVAAEAYIGDVLADLELATRSMVRRELPRILRKEASPEPQRTSDISYCAQRVPDDGLIDWRAPARQVFNFVRAQTDPYPGAFTWWRGERLRIWRARLQDQLYYGTPGQVARLSSEGAFVICGDHRPLVVQTAQLGDGDRTSLDNIISSINARFSNTHIESVERG